MVEVGVVDYNISREFIILPSFDIRWKRLGLNDYDLKRLENELLHNPKSGSVMQGTGGVRKMRFAFENKGKSGSTRIIYVDFEAYEKIYLLDVYAKAEKESLTKSERNELHALVDLLEIEILKRRK
jgi:hypothetical protein